MFAGGGVQLLNLTVVAPVAQQPFEPFHFLGYFSESGFGCCFVGCPGGQLQLCSHRRVGALEQVSAGRSWRSFACRHDGSNEK